MAKRIDDTVWKAIENAFLRRDRKPTYGQLAEEFGVSKRSIENKARERNWQEARAMVDYGGEAGEERALKRISESETRQPVDPIKAMRGLITDIYHEAIATEAKTKEGCVNAFVNLLKAQRELYPPNADDLAEMAVQLDITPDEFMEALKRRWAQGLEPVEDLAKVK